MSQYTIEEGVSGTLDDSAVGFQKYSHSKIYWVLRDGVRLVPPYDSRDEAHDAIRQLQEADSKKDRPA